MTDNISLPYHKKLNGWYALSTGDKMVV
jgi:hypothetical protein